MRLQGEDSEDFNIPALISLVLKCYEVARTIQVSTEQARRTEQRNRRASRTCSDKKDNEPLLKLTGAMSRCSRKNVLSKYRGF